MTPAGIGNVAAARWISKHWWKRRLELTSGASTLASVHIKGSRGTADIGNRRYVLARLRWPPFITIRDLGASELVVRFCLIPKRGLLAEADDGESFRLGWVSWWTRDPKRGLLAEFDDGESFRLGWVSWWKREWTWSNDDGEPVLSSRQSWLGRPIELLIHPAADTKTWPLLAVLELAMAELGLPWF